MLINKILLHQRLHGIPSRVKLGRISWYRERRVTIRLCRFNQLRFRHALRRILVERAQT